MDPWLVLAAELALERSATADRLARFAALRAVAPSPRALLAQEDPNERSKQPA